MRRLPHWVADRSFAGVSGTAFTVGLLVSVAGVTVRSVPPGVAYLLLAVVGSVSAVGARPWTGGYAGLVTGLFAAHFFVAPYDEIAGWPRELATLLLFPALGLLVATVGCLIRRRPSAPSAYPVVAVVVRPRPQEPARDSASLR